MHSEGWRHLRFSISICKALKHAHDRGIIHRDIKPANLLLTTEGDAKLLDFGIAKLYGSNNLTADHAIVGTADYMAPEQTEGARPSANSDLFSLSSSMYAALCGKPPFSAPNVPAIIHKVRFEEPVRIGKRVDDLFVLWQAVYRSPPAVPPLSAWLRCRYSQLRQPVSLKLQVF